MNGGYAANGSESQAAHVISDMTGLIATSHVWMFYSTHCAIKKGSNALSMKSSVNPTDVTTKLVDTGRFFFFTNEKT